MKPSKKLIEVLKEAAKYLEKNPKSFEWKLNNKCTCGIVAQVLMGLTNKTTFTSKLRSWTGL